jgi:hypothetical protein
MTERDEAKDHVHNSWPPHANVTFATCDCGMFWRPERGWYQITAEDFTPIIDPEAIRDQALQEAIAALPAEGVTIHTAEGPVEDLIGREQTIRAIEALRKRDT